MGKIKLSPRAVFIEDPFFTPLLGFTLHAAVSKPVVRVESYISRLLPLDPEN